MKKHDRKKQFMVAVNSVLVSAIIVGTITPRDANANIKDALGQMFLVSGTDPQVINTQRLRGYYGGNLSLRSPGRSFEIVQFAAPRIDAGCGGVDIFFGSFSFINGAQFEQLIRSIAANAVGYAIKLAIRNMCNPCGDIIDKLEDAIRQLNSLAKNTCAISMQSLEKAGAKVMEFGRSVGEGLKVAANYMSDITASKNSSQSEPPTVTAQGGNPAVGKENPILGNVTVRAAKETMPGGNNTMRAFMTDRQSTEMVQSLFGTVIVRKKDATDPPCPSGTSPERCDHKPEPHRSTIAMWDTLLRARNSSPNGVTMLRCLNWNEGCDKVATSVMPLSEWGGVADTVNIALFGTVNPNDRAAYTANSIIGSFVLKEQVAENGSNLSLPARQMVNAIPVPIIAMLLEVQKVPGAAQTMGLMLSQLLPPYFEYMLATELFAMGTKVYSGQTVVDPPEQYTEQIKLMSDQLNVMRPGSSQLVDIIDGMYKIIKQAQDLTSSPVRSGAK